MEKIAKSSPIFVSKVNNFSSLWKQSKDRRWWIWNKIMNEQIKIQPKSSVACVNILKELKNKNTEFYTYKPKQERSFKVVLKPYSEFWWYQKRNWRSRTRILLIHGTSRSKALHIFYVELKPKSNNKDIYKVGSLPDCRVKFKPLYSKREIPQCINC